MITLGLGAPAHGVDKTKSAAASFIQSLEMATAGPHHRESARYVDVEQPVGVVIGRRRKMDHSFGSKFAKQSAHQRAIRDIGLDTRIACASGDRGKGWNRGALAATVDIENAMAALHRCAHNRRADKSTPTCDQDAHKRQPPSR